MSASDSAVLDLSAVKRVPILPPLILALVLLVPLATAGDEKDGAAKIDPAITAFFDAAQLASMAKDPGVMVALWDMAEAVNSVERAGFLASVPEGRMERIKERIRLSLKKAFTRRPLVHPFQTYTIRRVSKGARPSTVTAYAWLRAPDGTLFKIRCFLVKRADSWALYDLEEPDMGLRTLHVFGMLLVETLGGVPAAWKGGGAKLAQAQAHLYAGEYEAAKGLLIELEAMALPDALASAIELMLAMSSLALGDLAAATKYLDEVADIGKNPPVQHFLRATIYNQQHLPEQALAEARRYIELLDAGPDVVLELALALRALGRGDEALAALTPAVRESPQDADLLAQYANCLPEARLQELDARFALLPDAGEGIRLAAELAVAEGLADRLHFFAGVLEKHEPGHHDVDFYEGHALSSEGKFQEAATRFEKAQAKVFALPQEEQPEKDGAEWRRYIDALLEALLAADDPCGAYDRAHDREHALDYLAEHLRYDGNAPALRTLLAHALAHPPKDGAALLALRAGYYSAEADVLDGKHASALKALSLLRPALEKKLEADDEAVLVWLLLYQVEERLVRLWLREKRYKEAGELVSTIGARDGPEHYLQALLHVAKGEVAKAVASIREAVKGDAHPDDFFDDADMGPILRGPAYAPLRLELLGEK